MKHVIKKWEIKLDNMAEKFLFHHPCLGFFLIAVGMPVTVLVVVAVCTVIIACPLSLIMEWW